MKIKFLTATIVAICLAVSVACFAACGNNENALNNKEQENKYLGEDFVFTYNSPAYTDPDYAEGKVFTYDTYTSTVHWTENKGNHIYTLLTMPLDYDASVKYPTLILCHGFNSTRTEYNDYLKYFTGAGYACISFDFRGGALSGCLSDGKLAQMTIDTEISDVKAVTAFAETLDVVDTSKMILVGHSQGGLVASLSAATNELKDKFIGLMLLAPGLEMVEENASKYKDGSVSIPNQVQVTAASMGLGTVNGDYVRGLLAHYDVFNEISAFTKPVKILLGTNDGLFTESAMQKAINAYGDKASYEMVENGAHNFLPQILETLCPDTILPFLNGLIK